MKEFDCSNSEFIGLVESRCEKGVGGYFCERLFKSKDGFFFLHCYGEAMTAYGTKDKFGNFISGEKIIPMDKAMVKNWIRTNMTEQMYYDIYGVSYRED